MAVRCSKCGEELLGAVNRCWKCGQTFALHPESDGRPPVRAGEGAAAGEPLEAIVLDPSQPVAELGPRGAAVVPVPVPRVIVSRRATTAERIEARRLSMIAMGGTVASVVLGVFTALLAAVWPPAAIVAVLGLIMGIWGLYSPRRNWALVGMLLCCLAIGFGTYGGARKLNDYWKDRTAISTEDAAAPDPE